MRHPKISTLLLCTALSACANETTEPLDGSPERDALAQSEPSLHGLDTLTVLGSDDDGPLGDEPGQLAFDAMAEAFADGTADELELAVYRLAPLASADDVLRQRADELSERLGQPALRPRGDAEATWTTLGDRQLRINRHSGSELLIDWSRFHQGKGEPSSLSDEHYWSLAGDYLEDVLATPTEDIDLYPYKIRHYWNAVAEQGHPAREEVYQVAVAFNTSIDGMPVIGSGSKVSIHLGLDGTVVGHELSTRRIAGVVTTIEGDDLLDPDLARLQIERRLAERGVDVGQYQWTRAELGYLRRGRASVQELVAPHYAFVAEPLEGVVGKKLVEVIPATTRRDVVELLERDDAGEQARLEEVMAFASEPDTKP